MSKQQPLPNYQKIPENQKIKIFLFKGQILILPQLIRIHIKKDKNVKSQESDNDVFFLFFL